MLCLVAEKIRIIIIEIDLAESVSESGAGDAGSDNDNVGVGVSGSTFSFSGGDAVHGLASRVWRISTVIVVLLLGHKSINRHERENRGQDPSQRVLIHHFHQCVPPSSRISLSVSLSLSLFSFTLSFSLCLSSLALACELFREQIRTKFVIHQKREFSLYIYIATLQFTAQRLL
jgi:hypothetical protein